MKRIRTFVVVAVAALAMASPSFASSEAEMWRRVNSDFHLSLMLAARQFNVSYSWLHACSHSEGSDRMVWNRQGSGAFGPMQFMRSTFERMSLAAWRDLGKQAPPARFRRWDSNVGQAYAAAWGFANGRSHEWTGSGC